ncbi:hypothetical protein DPX16_19537 [Anabarilius grahami]|uniref:Uncharacterized protein n=1 Tax=Anabarilius grahami TaxID=495550 RepID=A0A3N0Y8I9_ANAGA|nr:hypothetical protein DPX16_19537 [Anabarilius grahami]
MEWFSSYRVDLVNFRRSRSFKLKLATEMKFPADTESRRALTGRQKISSSKGYNNNERRECSICMGSVAGSGWLTDSGWRRMDGNNGWPWCSSRHSCIRVANLMDSWMNFSSPMESSYAAKCNRTRGSRP